MKLVKLIFILTFLVSLTCQALADKPWTLPEDRKYIPSIEGFDLYIDIDQNIYKNSEEIPTRVQEWQMGKIYKVYYLYFGKKSRPFCWIMVDRHFENYGYSEGRCDTDNDEIYETDIKEVSEVNNFPNMKDLWYKLQ